MPSLVAGSLSSRRGDGGRFGRKLVSLRLLSRRRVVFVDEREPCAMGFLFPGWFFQSTTGVIPSVPVGHAALYNELNLDRGP